MTRFERIVILTGAGISAESGISTFRDKDGIWSKVDFRDVATPEGFARDPQRVLDFYNMRRKASGKAEPNAGHFALRETRARTQGRGAGRHAERRRPARGGRHPQPDPHARPAPPGAVQPLPGAPSLGAGLPDLALDLACAACGKSGGLRPDVVWFGEMPYHMDAIYTALGEADLFISIGTSGNVYPAAGFVAEARSNGAHTVELNLEPSEGASLFAESHHGPASQVVPMYVDRLLDGTA